MTSVSTWSAGILAAAAMSANAMLRCFDGRLNTVSMSASSEILLRSSAALKREWGDGGVGGDGEEVGVEESRGRLRVLSSPLLHTGP